MLKNQREKASFNIKQLSYYLHGGKQSYESFKAIVDGFHNDPQFTYNPTFLHQSRSQLMITYAKHFLKFHQQYPLDGSNEHSPKAIYFSYGHPLMMHVIMFLNVLRNLCDQEQEKIFLEPALRGEIIGCYAQTQLAHGSDVQSIETTATYDSSNETFIINTPSITSTKWWIAEAGINCNSAVVYAQLIIDNKRYGPHVFFVPIRDPKTLQVLKGLEIGDIGPKISFQGKDNAYIIFNNVRIPRRNMLMKYEVVAKDGSYFIQGDRKISYATMLMTRALIPYSMAYLGTKTSLIATRYSLLRKQFKDAKGQQVPIFNYQTQQEKIIPGIAEAYCCWFASRKIHQLSLFVFNEAKNGRFKRLNEAHIIISAAKFLLSHDTIKRCQITRRSLGGHGFHAYSGFYILYFDSVHFVTSEGQNTVLQLQVGKFLMKCLMKAQQNQTLPESVQYYKNFSKETVNVPNLNALSCPYFIQKIFQAHSCGKIQAMGEKVSLLMGQNISLLDITNHHAGIIIVDAAVAHAYVLNYDYFLKGVEQATQPHVKAVLTKLIVLYALEKIVERSAKFFETGTLSAESFRLIYQKRQQLIEQLKPEALGLAEAFGYNDSMIMSAIANENEKPYQNLIQWAKKYNPLNKKQQRDQIISAIKQAKSQLRPRL